MSIWFKHFNTNYLKENVGLVSKNLEQVTIFFFLFQYNFFVMVYFKALGNNYFNAQNTFKLACKVNTLFIDETILASLLP